MLVSLISGRVIIISVLFYKYYRLMYRHCRCIFILGCTKYVSSAGTAVCLAEGGTPQAHGRHAMLCNPPQAELLHYHCISLNQGSTVLGTLLSRPIAYSGHAGDESIYEWIRHMVLCTAESCGCCPCT